jgi:hypothetical protein
VNALGREYVVTTCDTMVGKPITIEQTPEFNTCLYVFWNCKQSNMLEHSFCKLIPFARERLHGGASGDFELYFDELGRLGIHKVYKS